MAIRYIDPEDMYIVREMFGCGHGHAMPPGFTHWESGEGCIWTHSQDSGPGYGPGPTDNASYHYYWRLMLVPIVDGLGKDLYERALSEPNKFGHYPLAPEGLKEGQRVGDTIKLQQGVKLDKEVRKRYGLNKHTKIVYIDPPPREAPTTSDAAA